MVTKPIVKIIVILSLLLNFAFLLNNHHQYLFYDYVYAFKPSNAPAIDQTINQTTDNTSKHQQKSNDNMISSNEKVNNEITFHDKNTNTYKFIKSWGSYGKGDGQFITPWDIAVDSSNNIYVIDNGYNWVKKFDSNGNFITLWKSYWTKGKFYSPTGIAIDSKDNVYVIDESGGFNTFDHIKKFDSNGNFITKWGSNGTKDGQFVWPSDIGIDSQDNVYVVDRGNSRINVFAQSQ